MSDPGVSFVKRIGDRIAADFLFAVHVAQIALSLFGWLLQPPLYYVYVAVISVALISQFIWRDCFLTQWEFYFRRRLDPSIGKSPYFLTFYSHKYFANWVTDRFVDRISLIFLSVSILAAALRLAGYW